MRTFINPVTALLATVAAEGAAVWVFGLVVVGLVVLVALLAVIVLLAVDTFRYSE